MSKRSGAGSETGARRGAGTECRLCREHSLLLTVSPFSPDGRRIQLMEKIQTCLQITPHTNEPHGVCYKCINQLEDWYALINIANDTNTEVLKLKRASNKTAKESLTFEDNWCNSRQYEEVSGWFAPSNPSTHNYINSTDKNCEIIFAIPKAKLKKKRNSSSTLELGQKNQTQNSDAYYSRRQCLASNTQRDDNLPLNGRAGTRERQTDTSVNGTNPLDWKLSPEDDLIMRVKAKIQSQFKF